MKEISNNFKNMIKEAWYILEAKKIIGKWGYEEKAWWNPIAKALKKTDIEAYARGLHDGQIFGRKNEKLENNSHKHPCGNTPHCFCGKCSPTYNDTPQEEHDHTHPMKSLISSSHWPVKYLPLTDPQVQIRDIWDEMKELKRYRNHQSCGSVEGLEEKYEEIDTLFGHESTLSKAIIYYLNTKK